MQTAKDAKRKNLNDTWTYYIDGKVFTNAEAARYVKDALGVTLMDALKFMDDLPVLGARASS